MHTILTTNDPFDEKKRAGVSRRIKTVSKEAELLSLNCTKELADKILTEVDSFGAKDLSRRVTALQEILDIESKNIFLLYIERNRLAFLETQDSLFSDKVSDKFPAAKSEIEDAGKCFAMGSDTACAFHLMRAVEVGLKALCQKLK